MSDVLHRTTKQLLKSVNTPDYPVADWIRNPDLSSVSSVDVRYWKITGDVVSEMSAAEKTTEDDIPANLAALKAQRYTDIDDKTKELIAAGFTHATKTFSLSMAAQRNWTDLKNSDDAGWITYPEPVSTKDDNEHSLADSAALVAFCKDASDKPREHLKSGRDLKVSINDAVDTAAVDAIVDTR